MPGEEFKKCPSCAEQILAEAKYCKHCRRRVSGSAVPWRVIGLFAVFLLLVAWIVDNRPSVPGANAQSHQFLPSPGLFQSERKDWHEIARRQVVSDSVDLQGYSGWLHEPVAPSPIMKVFIIPTFSSSDPDRTLFAVMDSDNFERMQAGYPPLVLGSCPAGSSTPVEVPYGRRYWFGFIELAAKPTAPGSIPTSEIGALIFLMNEYQKRVHPPIRVTAQVVASIRMFSTEAAAQQEASKLNQQAQQ